MTKSILGASLLALVLVGCGASKFAEVQKSLPQMTKLTTAQIKTLVVDKPLVFSLNDGRVVSLLHKADGTLSGLDETSGNAFSGSWSVNNKGVKCLTTKRGKNCVNIFKSADGKYYTTRPGKTNILSTIKNNK